MHQFPERRIVVYCRNNAHHRRCIAASLVRGAYVVERDRQHGREGPNALAPPWWKSFNFQLIQELVDPEDSSVFGCVYHNYLSHDEHAPKYIITFRGNILKPPTMCQDLKLDLLCIRNLLHRSSRYQRGLKAVRERVAEAGANNIWLAGHSLGSAIALLIGRNMVRMDRCHIDQTYLFNPPFTSTVPLNKIMKNEKLRQGWRVASSVINGGLSTAIKLGCRQKPEQPRDDPFTVLSGWFPYFFVNPSDPICSGYIAYFGNREKIPGKLGKLAAQSSILTTISAAARGKDSDSDFEPFHLVPNAHLTTNRCPSEGSRQAHKIHQWWSSDVQLDYKLHEFKLDI